MELAINAHRSLAVAPISQLCAMERGAEAGTQRAPDLDTTWT